MKNIIKKILYQLPMFTTKREMNNIKSRISRIENVLQSNGAVTKNNFVAMLEMLLKNSNDSELYIYKRSKDIIFIFSAKLFQLDKEFVFDFLNYDSNDEAIYKINKLHEDSVHYKENIKSFYDKTYCIKYVNRNLYYTKTILYDKQGDLYIRKTSESYNKLPKDEYFCYNPTDRKYIKGVNFYDYVISKNNEEKKIILKTFYDYIFEKYSLPNGKINGEIFDAHLRNFIYDGNDFYPIDTEIKYKNGLEKELFIDSSLTYIGNELKPLVEYFFSLYDLKNFNKYFKEFNNRVKEREKFMSKNSLKSINAEEIKKYFG